MTDFMQDLQEMKVWIAMGGAASPETIAPMRIMPMTDLKPPAPSNGESEVSASDKELPTP